MKNLIRSPLVPLLILAVAPAVEGQEARPTSSDPAVGMVKFSGSDLIKHPTGITVTLDGKLLAIESHTHFKPEDYEGNETDQIWWIEDSDGDGKADKRTLFFEADLVATMDIATHPETGAIYVATRNEILRLWDKNQDGQADLERVDRRLVFLDTESSYPHDGCSGLTFDPAGNLFFGVGENLGAAYTLIGSDGNNYSDEGDGGNIWHCDRDGGDLRRIATGFWNPFGIVSTPGGHVFATDNDPGARPPSRLHHIIDGGDYGFQFRYGRNGHHPFISWNGELPGTLPMMHASGEAPCDVIFHQGHLLVASWADHRIEQYPLTWDETHFSTEQKILVQGGVDFRPVAFAKAQDGSLFVSDWVKRDYELHGEGAIWRLEGWNPEVRDMPEKTPAPTLSLVPQNLNTLDSWELAEAIKQMAESVAVSGESKLDDWPTGNSKNAFLLANQLNDYTDPHGVIKDALETNDATTQLLALKWISDHTLEKYRAEAEEIAAHPPSPILFNAAITTVARLDGQSVDDRSLQKIIAKRLSDKTASATVKRAAFQVVADRENFLSINDLKALFSAADEDLKIEVLLTMLVHPKSNEAASFAAELMATENEPERVKFYAVDVAQRDPKGSSTTVDYSAIDHDIGRRTFHRNCAGCHRALSFGRQGGPDLSTIGERGREHIVNSIINPSAEIAPQYEPWKLTLEDGSEKVGILLRQKGGNHVYADIAGNEFHINNRTIVSRGQLPISLMPPGLKNTMSDSEFEALISWLESLK